MEMKMNNISLKAILIVIGVGIWAIVLQNAGVIPTKQTVFVDGGHVDIESLVRVFGAVEVNGSVSVDNTVDVNIHEINGYNQVTTGIGTHSVFPFGYMLPVDNW